DLFEGDVYIEDEKVAMIGAGIDRSADRVIDAAGCYLFPGGIDAHTHMELPFMGTFASDTFESGTLAGLHGGTTTIVDFAIQTQGDSLEAAIQAWHEKADGHAVGDYAFHCAVTDFNENTRKEIPRVINEHGINSFKTFMAYKGALMVDDRQMFELMKELREHGGLLTSHCENGDMIDHMIQANLEAGNTEPRYHVLSRPAICEAEASGRVIDLAWQAGCPNYIVHLTCEEALERVRKATLRNQKVYVETCIQYLLLDESYYFKDGFEGAKVVMSPPLRKPKDQEALWAGINQGLVHHVATDHCPFCMEQKEMGIDNFSKIPNGAPGIENRVELLYSEGVHKGRISLNKFVEMSSTMAAKIFGLFPRKGTIAVGSDADIVIFDPEVRHTISADTHHMNVDYNAYEGWEVQGKTRTTVLRGTVAVDEGEAQVGEGFGKYLKRPPFNPHF
ncbi:MAG: dihydropyrimidinase, partial [Xanthomonadales bacterium]|nr:dihydropyrimidinase [Xanthomonadales bacterium]NIX13431.1 dihydropyrimidinase [Xanthomonadales bacterium]